MMIAVARAVVAARKVKEVRQDYAGFRPQYLHLRRQPGTGFLDL